MNRGDIWIVDLGGRIGRRPVVILTRDNVIAFLNKVTRPWSGGGDGFPVAAVTTRNGRRFLLG